MCGIVGYIGEKDACPILIKGLHRLEYRGYDSAGVALAGKTGEINVHKAKGRVSVLETYMEGRDVSGNAGIAHTRWATHGKPDFINAHPHQSQSGRFAMVHNGIIENYSEVKAGLEAKGYVFRSSTDSEVIVYLVEDIVKEKGCSVLEALSTALASARGAYAICLMDRETPDRIYAARRSSPLAVGKAADGFYIASDASPIVEYTRDVFYLSDNQTAILYRNGEIDVYDADMHTVIPEFRKVDLNPDALEKGEYPHYMLKEIHEQPVTLRKALTAGMDSEGRFSGLEGVMSNSEVFASAGRIIIVACGTSWHAALVGERMMEDLCRIPVDVEYASEFRYNNPVIRKDDVVVAVSQSGETADTMAALELAKNAGAFTYGICNVPGSSLSRLADAVSYMNVGPEIGVASTKAYTGQLAIMAMMSMSVAIIRGTAGDGRISELCNALAAVPAQLEKILVSASSIERMAMELHGHDDFIYLGRGYNFPTALEGALKLKEISYIHAEGYPSAEMKHGPIALIDGNMPVVIVAVQDATYEKTVSNIQEIRARKGRVVSLVTEGDAVVSGMSDFSFPVPASDPFVSPVLCAVPLQLLAYYIAVLRGCDVDQPRNLAKSVTVE